MPNITAIIPARSGSKSVVDKNILPLNGFPILAYSIAAAKLSKKINRIVVSTDSEMYASIAKDLGAEVPFLRPSKYASDTSQDRDFFLHAIKWFQENEGKIPEIWAHLRPTTPLREPNVIDQAVNLFLENPDATSLRSAHPAPESPMKWFIKRNKYFKGFVDSDISNFPKEFFEQTYIPNGYIDIIKSSTVLNKTNIHGDRVLGFISPTISEIDSIEEFNFITYQLGKKDSLLKNYLEETNYNAR